MDSRFVVIHKENGGISSARNAGLDAAKAEYIGFIDNDDWVEPETYELALAAARQTGADIVQWRYVAETRDGPRPSKERLEGEFDLAESPEYYCGLVWERFFKASIIFENQIRFPLGSNIGSEDTFFSVLAYLHSKKAYFINKVFYHQDKTHVSTSNRIVTADEVMGLVNVTKETCKYIELLADRDRAFADFIVRQKAYAKLKAIHCMKPPNIRLFLSIFPELNSEFRFIRLMTKQSLIHLLYAWRMDWLVMTIVWVKGRLRRLAGRG